MKTEIKWAMVIGVLSLLWFVLEKVCGFYGDFIEYLGTVAWFFLIPFAMVYWVALLQKREGDLGGKMTYMQGLKTSAIIAAISIPFVIIAILINIKFISPDFQSMMTEHLITTGVEIADAESKMSTLSMAFSGVFYALSGIVVGGIVSLFVKNA